MSVDLRLGDWRDVLADVTECDSVLSDPPYGSRTHEGHNAAAGEAMEAIAYDSLAPADVADLVGHWAVRTRQWMGFMTSHDLIGAYESAYLAAGWYAFAPVPIIQKRPRLVGDGPSSWAVYLMVARQRSRQMATWGCLPGAYDAPTAKGSGIAGAKPLDLMSAIVRDYTRVGDLVVDPFAGSGTTALACAINGRRCITSERDPKHYEIAKARLTKGHTPDMFAGRTD